MLTPPYHHSIVAAPLLPLPHDDSDILYRGSIPLQRNLPFLNRLKLRTIVYLRKKELPPDDTFQRWAKRRGVAVRWIKAEGMSEEKLGIGKNEVNEVLRIILDRSSYPLYIADIDGISHTTLIVACLRKLQGWHMDSIIDEICRYEPEHEDFSIMPFITSYLAGADSAFSLPSSTFPSWLWPAPTAPLTLTRTTTRDRSQSTVAPPPNPLLPFPHPVQARRHPTMKLTFPNSQGANPVASPLLPASTNSNSLSRVPTRADKPGEENRTPATTSVNIFPSSIAGVLGAVESTDEEGATSLAATTFSKIGRLASGSTTAAASTRPVPSSGSTSPSPDGSTLESDVQMADSPTEESPLEADDDDEEDFEDDDEEEDEDEDEDELQPTSQYISALDLAGFA